MSTPFNVPGYEKLADVLVRAYAQASEGKGKERHAAAGEPFHEQVICIGARKFGVGSMLYQAFKKAEESQRLPLDAAKRELFGGIVYLAAAVIELDRQEAEAKARENNDVPAAPSEPEWINVKPSEMLPPPSTLVQLKLRDGTLSDVSTIHRLTERYLMQDVAAYRIAKLSEGHF